MASDIQCMDTVSRFIPCKRVTCKAFLPPWITNSVRRVISKRNRTGRLSKRSNTPSAWATFRRLQNLVFRKAKSSFFYSLTSNSSKFWKMYHRLSGNSTKVPSTLSDGNHSVSTSLEKATMLNDYFATCFTPSCSSIPSPPQTASPHPSVCCRCVLCHARTLMSSGKSMP